MCACNRQFTQLLCCFPVPGRCACSIRCAIGTDQSSRIQRLHSRAKAAKGKVFGSFICGKPLQAPGLTDISLALTTFRRAKHQVDIDHLGMAAARRSTFSFSKNA